MDKHVPEHGGDRGGEGTGGKLPPLLAAGPSTPTRTHCVQGPVLARTDRVTLARTDRVTLGCTSAAGPEPEAGCKGQQGGERGQDQKPQQGAAGSQSSRPKPRLHLEEKLRHPPSRHQAQVPVETQTWVAPCLPWGRGSPTHVRGPSGQRWLQGQAEHLRCLRDGEAAAGTGAVCAGHGAEEGPGMAPSGSGWQPQLQLPGGAGKWRRGSVPQPAACPLPSPKLGRSPCPFLSWLFATEWMGAAGGLSLTARPGTAGTPPVCGDPGVSHSWKGEKGGGEESETREGGGKHLEISLGFVTNKGRVLSRIKQKNYTERKSSSYFKSLCLAMTTNISQGPRLE